MILIFISHKALLFDNALHQKIYLHLAILLFDSPSITDIFDCCLRFMTPITVIITCI